MVLYFEVCASWKHYPKCFQQCSNLEKNAVYYCRKQYIRARSGITFLIPFLTAPRGFLTITVRSCSGCFTILPAPANIKTIHARAKRILCLLQPQHGASLHSNTEMRVLILIFIFSNVRLTLLYLGVTKTCFHLFNFIP